MADSGEIPKTLAEMRQNKTKLRGGRAAPPQLGLGFGEGSEVRPVERVAAIASKVPESEKLVMETAGPQVWTVASLVANVRQQMERGYRDVWVEGEISNLRLAPSGHLYFTLKDGEAQLGIVLFRRQAQWLRFRPKDGMAVKIRGTVSVYEARGQLQLIAETMEEVGTGALLRAFEVLKARLRAEGLFDRAKQALPPFPRTIGVVTSPTGAVIRDIVHVVRRRHARLNVVVYPAAMQGTNCARTVAQGVRWFNAHPELVEVIVIARGGGSVEDLAGFNDEALARVIAGSKLPVVSAIGHETDFTIADFVADVRAATPSAAAELVTAAQHRIEERVEALAQRVRRAGSYHLMHARQRMARLGAGQVLAQVRNGLERREQRLDELAYRLNAAKDRLLRMRVSRVAGLEARLGRLSPAVRLANAEARLARAKEALPRVAAAEMMRRRTRLERAVSRLETLSPLAVLSRGYAIVYDADGRILRDAAGAAVGSRVRARLAEGTLEAEVTGSATSEVAPGGRKPVP